MNNRKNPSVRVEPILACNDGEVIHQWALLGKGDHHPFLALKAGALVQVCPAYRPVSSAGQSPQMHAVYGSKGLPRRTKVLLDALRTIGMRQGFETTGG